MRARLRIKTTQIPPLFPVFQYSNLSFPYLTYTLHILTYPTILCTLFTLSTCRVAEKISRRAEHRCIFFFFFFFFVCIKGYPSLAPKKENFTMESVEKAMCESSSHQESSVHIVPKGHFATQD